jgi:hypothetical protein
VSRHHLEHLEARFARRVGAHLAAHLSAAPSTHAAAAAPPRAGGSDPLGLDHDVRERLKGARQVALARRKLPQARAAERPAAGWSALPAADGSASLGGFGGRSPAEPSGVWSLLGQVLPAALLVLALVGLSEWQQRNQLNDLAELDIAVLADELPPQAYVDPGFAQFLKAELHSEEAEALDIDAAAHPAGSSPSSPARAR